jgi:hypothetical protein
MSAYYKGELRTSPNSRKSWNIVNFLLGRSRKSSKSDNCVVDGTLTFNSNVIADGLNTYFSHVGGIQSCI